MTASEATLSSMELEDTSVLDTSDILWLYRNKGSINGVAVDPLDRDLPIGQLDLLEKIFTLLRQVHIWAGWVSPENKEALKKYNDIMSDIEHGICTLISLDKQYLPTLKAFMVVLTFAELKFKLADRYSYYRLDMKHG